MSHPLVVNKRKAPYDVYIGRPSKWGNPFMITPHCGRSEVLLKYRAWIFHPDQDELRNAARKELFGKVLGCYCAPLACHGDILAEIANETVPALPHRPVDRVVHRTARLVAKRNRRSRG